MQILVINAGSSSLKLALFQGERLRLRIHIGGLEASPWVRWGEQPRTELPGISDHHQALRWVLERLRADGLSPDAAGHRIVHGGVHFHAPRRLDDDTLAALERLIPLAPLHQPHNLAAVRALARLYPRLPQVACFDTAFHHTQPEPAQRYALPREWHERGLRAYGFHGLAYESVLAALRRHSDPLPPRLILAHLGAGASLCAVRDGRSQATTMGLTPLDGVPMATRPGHLDPGAVPFLLRQGLDLEAVERLLYHHSGWLGVSGISSDMRRLLSSDDPRAAEAVTLFCYRVVREIGSLAAALGGVDALVFSGGVGENAATVRARILDGCRWLGFQLDPDANARHGPRITGEGLPAWVIPSDEETLIARETQRLLLQGGTPS